MRAPQPSSCWAWGADDAGPWAVARPRRRWHWAVVVLAMAFPTASASASSTWQAADLGARLLRDPSSAPEARPGALLSSGRSGCPGVTRREACEGLDAELRRSGAASRAAWRVLPPACLLVPPGAHAAEGALQLCRSGASLGPGAAGATGDAPWALVDLGERPPWDGRVAFERRNVTVLMQFRQVDCSCLADDFVAVEVKSEIVGALVPEFGSLTPEISVQLSSCQREGATTVILVKAVVGVLGGEFNDAVQALTKSAAVVRDELPRRISRIRGVTAAMGGRIRVENMRIMDTDQELIGVETVGEVHDAPFGWRILLAVIVLSLCFGPLLSMALARQRAQGGAAPRAIVPSDEHPLLQPTPRSTSRPSPAMAIVRKVTGLADAPAFGGARASPTAGATGVAYATPASLRRGASGGGFFWDEARAPKPRGIADPAEQSQLPLSRVTPPL